MAGRGESVEGGARYGWMFRGRIGGYVKSYPGVDVATVKGAGHMVPTSRPGPMLQLLANFIHNTHNYSLPCSQLLAFLPTEEKFKIPDGNGGGGQCQISEFSENLVSLLGRVGVVLWMVGSRGVARIWVWGGSSSNVLSTSSHFTAGGGSRKFARVRYEFCHPNKAPGLGYKFLVVLVRIILREAQKIRVFTEHLHYFQSNLV